jgi:hypothetical protein
VATWLGALLVLQAHATTLPPQLPVGTTVHATLAAAPPVLDGRDDDPVWRGAPAVDQFLQLPSEGAPARFRTAARMAYDARHLYVFVRAFDPRPDSIVSLLSRRDEQTASDEIILMLDPYHDRRTGYEFAVNPAWVKADYAVYNDGDEDVAWDAVWDAATRIDSLGWTAEYRIPLSQLHYSGKGNVTFGLLVWRTIQRHTETVTWPLYRPSRSGFISQFGELTGLDGLASRATRKSRPTSSPRTSPTRRRPISGATRRCRSAATSSTGSPPTCCSRPPSIPTSARSRPTPRSSTSALSRPSSPSSGRFSWRGRGSSPST